MKKIYLSLIILLFSFGQLLSQKNLFEAIKDNGEEVIYTEFLSLTPTANGTRIEMASGRVTYKIENNVYGKPSRAQAYDAYEGRPNDKDYSRSIFYSERSNTDHYVIPSFSRNSRTGEGFAMVDNFLFKFSKISEDGSSFKIGSIFIPDLKLEENVPPKEGAKKKKLSLKQRLEAAKIKLASKFGTPMYNKASKMNLDETVKTYFIKMKEKQKAYTYSTQDLKEIQGLKDELIKKDEDIKKYNDSVIATPKYQRMLKHRADMDKMKDNAGPTKVTLKNNSSKQIDIMGSSGGSEGRINAGSTSTFNCDRDLYLGYKDGNSLKKGRIIYNKNSGCGKTISIN